MVEDDSNVTTLTQHRCVWFNFFKPEFEGPLSSYCVLFDEKLYENKKIYMKNVISGLGKPDIIWLDPSPNQGLQFLALFKFCEIETRETDFSLMPDL